MTITGGELACKRRQRQKATSALTPGESITRGDPTSLEPLSSYMVEPTLPPSEQLKDPASCCITQTCTRTHTHTTLPTPGPCVFKEVYEKRKERDSQTERGIADGKEWGKGGSWGCFSPDVTLQGVTCIKGYVLQPRVRVHPGLISRLQLPSLS